MMSRLLFAIALLALAPAPASATSGDACCACVEGKDATTNGPAPVQALFCGEFADTTGPGEECEQLGGSLLCIREVARTNAPVSNTCQQLLAGENIACPSAARAPVAGPGMLIGLAALLGLAGVAAVRRSR
jgi:hypothetical protein